MWIERETGTLSRVWERASTQNTGHRQQPQQHTPFHTHTPPPTQMMTAMLGGEVKASAHGGEYGRMAMNIQPGSRCFSYLESSVQSLNVWMSHGDEAVKLPEGFKAVAMSQQV